MLSPHAPTTARSWPHATTDLGGFLLVDQKNYSEAKKFYDALALHQRLADDFPTLPEYQNNLAGTLLNIAILHNHRREYAAAVSLVKQARPRVQAALKANPNNLTYRQCYQTHLRTLAWSRVRPGRSCSARDDGGRTCPVGLGSPERHLPRGPLSVPVRGTGQQGLANSTRQARSWPKATPARRWPCWQATPIARTQPGFPADLRIASRCLVLRRTGRLAARSAGRRRRRRPLVTPWP